MPATIDHIEAFYAGQKRALNRLLELHEISLANDVESALAKNLVIASASYFEVFITEALARFATENSKHEGLSEFCRRVSQRQYHTWFDWDQTNANKFLALFGDEAKSLAAQRLAQNEEFAIAVRNFMFLGSQRNLIVHRNMLAFSFSDTSEDVIAKVRRALGFVNFIATDLFMLE